MTIKKIVVIIFLGIFLLTSKSFAQSESLQAVEEPFADSVEKKSSVVNKTSAKNSKSSTKNRTNDRDKKRKSEKETEKAPIPVDEPFQEPKPDPIPEIKKPSENLEDGAGLEFLMYNANGIQAFAVIADHERYKLRPIIAQHQIKGRSTVLQMAGELNDIATINAGYFDADGSLFGVTKVDGLIVSSDYFTRSAIGINSDGSTIFGQVQYSGAVLYNGETIFISGVNCTREENSLVVYNEYYSPTTGTNNFGIEIIEQDGIIIEIHRHKGNNAIPKGGHVISAHGSMAENFVYAKVGDEIIFQESIDSEDADFNSAVHVLGAGPRLVRDGRIFVTAADEKFPSDISVGRAPRSAVGVTKYGDYIFAVVDGRQAHSKGCTLQEWANILLNNFGAFNAINLDGGGSTELTVKDKLVNSPSDGRERAVGSALTILPK
ncbi:MAG: phosphodiester glycosidase family protein [Selenomonadaceae bacterium]|nr:phosphodiester glycosidase family protein [Selenomonadaceae bacterium]